MRSAHRAGRRGRTTSTPSAGHLGHTMDSYAFMNGVPVPVISQVLGHNNVGMTLRNAYLAEGHTEAAAERVCAAMARATPLESQLPARPPGQPSTVRQ